MVARRWWHTSGPWTARLEPPKTEAPRWLPAWGALLAGGEIDMPLPGGDRPAAPAHRPEPRPARPRQARLASVEAALLWSRAQLSEAPQGWTIGLWAGRPSRLRWRARSERELRELAREMAGWLDPPELDAVERDPAERDAAAPDPVAPDAAAQGPSAPPADLPLSPAQRRVVDHDGGRAVVVAVAGAGKTTTMVARVRHRVHAGLCDPAGLLMVSFSRAAVSALLGKLAADPALAAVDVRTFHSLAHLLLRTRHRLGLTEGAAAAAAAAAAAVTVMRPPSASTAGRSPPPEQVVEAVARAARREAQARDPDLAQAWNDVDLQAFASYRGRSLARLELPGLGPTAAQPWPLPAGASAQARPLAPDPDQPDHLRLLEDFERKRRELGWLDHDQSLVEAWSALHGEPRLLAWARQRWRSAVVDEAQDLNAVQLAILELIMEGRADVVLVGDDAQSVYGFRGASPGLLQAFAQRHGAALLVLDQCFRSRAEPLAAAASLMADGPARPRAARGLGGRLLLDEAAHPRAEAERLVARLLEHRASGLPWCEQAVLVRRFDQTPAIELAAGLAGVPLLLQGAPPLAQQPAVLDAWAGLLLATGLGLGAMRLAARERLWRRWLVGPGALPPAAALAAARHLAAEAPLPGAEAWVRAAPRGADAHVGERLRQVAATATQDLSGALLAAGSDPRRWPARPAATLLAHLALLQASLAGASSGSPDLEQALGVYRASLRRPPEAEAVVLSSVHRAKGLEWTVVHVPGMNTGTFPTGDDPEERRLAYVAWTRARDVLHLYRDRLAPPSPFLTQGGVEALLDLQWDLAWLRACPPDEPAPLAARWALQEARERLGVGALGLAPQRER